MNLQIPYTFANAGGMRQLAAWLDVNFTYLLNLIASVGPAQITNYEASEAIAANSLVNIWNNGGVAQIRNANGLSGRQAHGFVSSALQSLKTGPVTFYGVMGGLSGLTPGAPVFLALTAGGVTQTAPASGSGDYLQNLGFANGTNSIVFFGGPMNGPM